MFTRLERILVAADMGPGAGNALGRACRMAEESGAELRILTAVPPDASDEDCHEIRIRLRDRLEAIRPWGVESSVRLSRREPRKAILAEIEAFRPGLVVLGAHGRPRLRDAVFGTTASYLAQRISQPILVAQNDESRPYARVMAAVDQDAAEAVLETIFSLASAKDLFVVHAFGSHRWETIQGGGVMEDSRTEHGVLTLRVRERSRTAGAAEAAVHIHHVVKRGAVMKVIMDSWRAIHPDLLVMGTHGRSGLSRLLFGGYAEAALLGCPSDILVVRAPDERAGPA